MVFSSAIFLLRFLPIVFIANFLVKREYSNGLLLLASLIFYAWGEPVLVLLMIVVILINWFVGSIIGRTEGKTRKTALIIGVVCDIAILGYYKYIGFAVSVINRLLHKEVLADPGIALPIGISFFIFQAISYIADVYKGDTEASPKLVNVALYISFFPQLIAGPIVKYKDINKQIEDRAISWDATAAGFKRFIYGLAKKVLISNALGLCVDTIFGYGTNIDGKAAWIGALMYSFQIYYDFSGYSDMAIGLGKMFGFNIPENFNYPYLSGSITEFWRRWHISLGSWFREYVYIPLGGNRKGKVRTYINLVIVFFLTGLWHGAGFSFVFWGLYHGFFSIIEKICLKKYLDRSKIISKIYCFFVVTFGWVMFRANSMRLALRHLVCMITPWRYSNTSISIWSYLDNKIIFISICAVIGMGIMRLLPRAVFEKWRDSAAEAMYCVALLILCLAALASDTYNPFIYFQF